MHLEKLALVLSAVIACVLSSKFLDQEWKAWKNKHDKEYNTLHDAMFRRKAWEATWHKVQKHNQLAEQGLSTYRMAMNKFADMTPEERTSRKCFLSNKKSTSQKNVPVQVSSTTLNIPESVDWRDSKCVTRVKDQGFCGSCWAFATVGVFESHHCIKTKELVEFSEQQLVDCDSGNDACCGGLPENAMAYISKHGIMKAKDYEYADKHLACSYKPDNAVTFNLTKYYILPGEENMALSLAFDGPMSVGIDASDDFQLYRDGIYDGECTPEPNHAVIVVGYGTEHDEDADEDIDYWIVRNSWGEDWGENGYVKMRRNVNLCGIATDASSVDMTR
ncbi:cathepsin L-like proteinase [Rhinoderma darwinii]|uniref:cathepsin L-like proteinase n=1 Tax=Rhinoderma darwinii TaxID=43563 RepID=UPI003F67E1DD